MKGMCGWNLESRLLDKVPSGTVPREETSLLRERNVVIKSKLEE